MGEGRGTIDWRERERKEERVGESNFRKRPGRKGERKVGCLQFTVTPLRFWGKM